MNGADSLTEVERTSLHIGVEEPSSRMYTNSWLTELWVLLW
jgi:hypothetical protein